MTSFTHFPFKTRFSEVKNPGQPLAKRLRPGKDNGRLFHDQIILYGTDSLDAPCDFNRFIDGLLRVNEAAQLDYALESLDTDLEGL